MKILCLGNNSRQTDELVSKLAKVKNQTNYGLITSIDIELNSGYYHTSIFDLSKDQIIQVSSKFDLVLVLDQPIETWDHPNSFYLTWDLLDSIDQTKIQYQNKSNGDSVRIFSKLVNENKSFCIFPFIELLVQNGSTTVCCRSWEPIKKLKDISDWSTDSDYLSIRTDMINGKLVENHCKSCYNLESHGMQSARQVETIEWANRLQLTSIEDVINITTPVYYEVRPDNICNLQCRTCGPESSNQIFDEYVKIGWIDKDTTYEYTNFDFVKLDKLEKLYVSGGEPTASYDLQKFMIDCINNQKTDFEFIINTNATKISSRMKELFKQFSKLSFIVSVDAYQALNHYIRYPSTFDQIIDNARYLIDQGHVVSFNTVVSIYNISKLAELFLFLDKEFPTCLIHCSLAGDQDNIYSPFLYPDYNLVKPDLEKIFDTNCYKNDRLFRTFIDSLINFKEQTDIKLLTKFFEYNDRLDQSRNIRLKDYLPDLDKFRQLCYN